MVFFLFGIKNPISVIPENKLKCGWPQIMFVLFFSPFEMSLGLENLAAFMYRIDVWLLPYIMEFQVALLDAVVECVK